MYADLPLDQLRCYFSPTPAPPGLDAFWAGTLREARACAREPVVSPVGSPLRTVQVHDVTISGFGGAPVKAWFVHPSDATEPLPCIVDFIGYGGGRGHATDWLLFPSCGYSTLVMDNRGQGSSWQRGDTADPQAGAHPSYPGHLTAGIQDPATAYYRRLFTDAAMAVAAARSLPLVDADRIVVNGGSQGGALALAAAALDGRVRAVMADVPFLSDIRRAVTLVDTDPYREAAAYLRIHRDQVDRALATLDHFDTIHLAARCSSPALFSVGLMDDVCPPSTVYAAYNAYAGPKQIVEYPFNGHEGGGSDHVQAKLAWLPGVLA